MKIFIALLIGLACYNYEQIPKSLLKVPDHNQSTEDYYYLALGDSYTIGEQVPNAGNFPNQVAALMRLNNPGFQEPRIIAKTGWTCAELAQGIYKENSREPLRNRYDFVSLLIGVNDQFRGYPLPDYYQSFESLLKQAIHFAGDAPGHVIVLSIPDWAATPFGVNYDRKQVAEEIDGYNKVNKEIAEKYAVHYLDITAWTREGLDHPDLVTTDGLHPSAKEYSRWAEKIAAFFSSKY
jgi:lysophospholipase L1-like esterase